MVLVKFKGTWRSYFSGDVAGFDPATAALLVEQKKVATYVKPAVTSDAVQPENAATTAVAPDYESMTVVRLKELAKGRNVHLKTNVSKEEIITALVIADEESHDEAPQ